MKCCVSGVKNIARKPPVDSGFRESNSVFKFPVSLNKLHCHLNAPQIGKTIFKGFSYFPPLRICFHRKMVMLGTWCNHSSIYLPDCQQLISSSLKCHLPWIMLVSLPIDRWTRRPCLEVFLCAVPEENNPVQVIQPCYILPHIPWCSLSSFLLG